MGDLSIGQQIAVSIVAVIVIWSVIWPWLSLTNLNKLSKIADELERIRKELEKRAE